MTRICRWKPCQQPQASISTYCDEHRERARRNVLLALGLHAPTSLMWRDGDESWLLDEMGVADPKARVLVRGRLTASTTKGDAGK